MGLELTNFSTEHIDAAAALVCARHHRLCDQQTALAKQVLERPAVRMLLTDALNHADGVAAIRDGGLVGFLIGTIDSTGREEQIFVGAPQYAVAPEESAELYWDLYAAAAPRWLEHGCLTHTIELPAGDSSGIDAWFSMGFGRFNFHACREIVSSNGDHLPVSAIHEAGLDDIDAVVKLRMELLQHSARSPTFLPLDAPPNETLLQLRSSIVEDMAARRSVYWLASAGQQPIGLLILRPPMTIPPEASIFFSLPRCIHLWIAVVSEFHRVGGVGTALLNHALRWAHDQGYEHCTVAYLAANPTAARFWRRSGFLPLAIALQRRLDRHLL